MRLLFAIVLCCLSRIAVRAQDDRFLLPAEINGQPAQLMFDTGSSIFGLYPEAVKRLGLEIFKPAPSEQPTNGNLFVGRTEMYEIRIAGATIRTSFGIWPHSLNPYDFPYDGMMGWDPVRANVFIIEASTHTLRSVGQVAAEAAHWTKFRVLTNYDNLALEIPGSGTNTMVVDIDTGKPQGVTLSPQRWKAWVAKHPRHPQTPLAYFMLGTGDDLKVESWADEIALGPLLLTDVPVMEANISEVTGGGPRYAATLGMAALKRLNLVVDGKNNFAYVRPKRTPPATYQHNRLGAVFISESADKRGILARVWPGTPAYEAGIRDGDVLLKVNQQNMADWQKDPAIPNLILQWDKPAGTKFDLLLKRGSETFKTTVVLREILKPENPLPVPKEALAQELDWLTKLAESAFWEGHADEAINNFTEIIRLQPDSPRAFNGRGAASLKFKDRRDQAMSDFNEAIRLQPDYHEAFYNRGTLWQDNAKAIADFTEAIRLDRDDADAFHDRGFRYALMGNDDAALADLSEAVRLNTNSPRALFDRGVLYAGKGEYAKAVADEERALELEPANPQRCVFLARTLAVCPDDSVRNGQKAVEYALKACDFTKWQDASVIDVLAMAYAAAGNFPEAVKQEQTVLRANLPAEARTAAEERLKLYQQNRPYRETGK